jgi:hypothetical protein
MKGRSTRNGLKTYTLVAVPFLLREGEFKGHLKTVNKMRLDSRENPRQDMERPLLNQFLEAIRASISRRGEHPGRSTALQHDRTAQGVNP